MQINDSVNLPRRLDLNENPVTELEKATDEWIDHRKLSSLDEWVSIPITALPFIIAIISLIVPSRAVLLSVVAGGLSFLFWVGYKIAKAKRSIELRFFIIAIFLQAILFFTTNTIYLLLIIWSGIETVLPDFWDVILKLLGVSVGLALIWLSMKQWGFGPCRVADWCWRMIVKEIPESPLDSWNHREGIQNEIGLANCRLCGAMMRPGAFIGIILVIAFILGLFGNATFGDIVLFLAGLIVLFPVFLYLANNHVKDSRELMITDLERIDNHIELLHEIVETS